MRRLLQIVLTGILLSCVLPLSAQDQVSRKARLEREIQMIEQQLRDNASKNSSALTKLSLVRQKENKRRALIKESDREIAGLSESIMAKNRQMRQIQARLDTMTLYYNRLIKNAYKNRDARVWYMYILSSNNLKEASHRYTYLKSLSSQMNLQARKIGETKAEMERELANLKEMRAKAKKLREARAAELTKLEKEEAQNKKLVSQLGREKTRYQKELTLKKKQVEDLNRELQRAIVSSKKSSSGRIDYVLSGEFQKNKGVLPWPADGFVADHFGRNSHPVFKNLSMPFNNGINITVSKDTAVRCVFDGEVKKVIVMPGYNKCVLVQHGEFFTFYCKLASVKVKAGDKLKTGQTVGVVDTIDGQTQLHFQLWKDKVPQNPELWLRPRD